MRSEDNLRRLGLEESGPLRAGHPECGLPCLLCKRPIQVGDAVGHIPQNAEDERSATLVALRLSDHGGVTREAIDQRDTRALTTFRTFVSAPSDRQFNPIVRRMHEVLLRAEVPFGRLDGGMPQQQLDLLQFPACGAAHFRATASIMPHAALSSLCRIPDYAE